MSADLVSFAGEKFNWLDCVMRDPALQPSVFKTAYAILQHVNAETGKAWVSDDTIAAITGFTRNTVRLHREALKAAGWLAWERTTNANRYEPLFDKVNAGLDAIAVDREQRREDRRIKRAARAQNSAGDASPTMQQNLSDASPMMQGDASPTMHHDASPAMHIHLRHNTYEITPTDSGWPSVEEPLPAIEHPQLAEMRLLDELGGGDADRGATIAATIGNRRFDFLHRELMRGQLYPSAIRAASQSTAGVAA